MQLTRVCFGCKESFRKEEMIEYASAKAIHPHWYCPQCLKEKQEREWFADRICEIFGLKTPGPVIWRQRKDLQDKYGYTDGVIIDCLNYLYNVQHLKKLSETLVLVTPSNVMAMKKWKANEKAKTGELIAAMVTPVKRVQVEIDENTTSNKKEINIDELLMD